MASSQTIAVVAAWDINQYSDGGVEDEKTDSMLQNRSGMLATFGTSNLLCIFVCFHVWMLLSRLAVKLNVAGTNQQTTKQNGPVVHSQRGEQFA